MNNIIQIGKDGIRWNCMVRVLKYKKDVVPYKNAKREIEFFNEFDPFDVVESEGNLLLWNGMRGIWLGLWGSPVPYGPYNSTYAQIGVGDSSTAATASQTDLLGSNKTYIAMDSTYPQISGSTPPSNTYQSSFGSAQANYAWNEFVLKSTYNSYCLNRKVQSLGTKTAGTTWVLQMILTML
jgi:hypothetical protein